MKKKQWLVLGTLMVGVFLGALDISIVSPALTDIAQSLDVSGRYIAWVVTVYTLAYVIAVPTMSTLSDRFSRRRALLVSLSLFVVGSGVSLWASSFAMLLLGRAIQAFGGGGLFPIASTVVAEVFSEKKRGMALGFIGMMWGVAAIIGPLLGGWLTQWYGWRSLFLLSLGLGLLVTVGAYLILPKDKPISKQPLDVRGLLLLGSGLAALTYGLNHLRGGVDTVSSVLHSPAGWWLLGALVLLLLFVKSEQTAAAPALAPALFTDRSIAIATLLSFTRGMIEAGLVFLPLYAMTVLGIPPGPAGSLVIVSAVTVFLFTEPAGMLVDRIGARPVLLAGAAFTVLGALLLMLADTYLTFILYQIVLGLGLVALSGAPIRYVVFAKTNKRTRASAQGAVSLFSTFGIMIGTAVAGSFLATETITSFQHIYVMVAVVALVALLATVFLERV